LVPATLTSYAYWVTSVILCNPSPYLPPEPLSRALLVAADYPTFSASDTRLLVLFLAFFCFSRLGGTIRPVLSLFLPVFILPSILPHRESNSDPAQHNFLRLFLCFESWPARFVLFLPSDRSRFRVLYGCCREFNPLVPVTNIMLIVSHPLNVSPGFLFVTSLVIRAPTSLLIHFFFSFQFILTLSPSFRTCLAGVHYDPCWITVVRTVVSFYGL